jgi:hypothetical protein
VDTYEFTSLAWLALSDKEATKASKWYQGSGWYVNPVDETGQLQPPRLILESETSIVGQMEALRQCGQEGWFVAVLVPAPSPGMWEHLLFGIVGLQPTGPHFILQRRRER